VLACTVLAPFSIWPASVDGALLSLKAAFQFPLGSVDPAMDDEEAELMWEVHPDGTLYASVEAAPPQWIESTGALFALVRH
jgi:hypothetical protein